MAMTEQSRKKIEGMQPEERFRRLAVASAVSIWIGLILLAIGLVFTFGCEQQEVMRMRHMAALAISTGVSSPAPALASSPTATLTPTAVPVMESVTAMVATATATLTPVPTATFTPVPSPTPAGPPDRIVIPAIGVDAPVVEVGWHEEVIDGARMVVWDVADYAAGWHKTSARPGEVGNIVISGHHNIRGEVFRDIVTLEPGAEVVLYVGETPYTYFVVETQILAEKGMPLEVRRQNAAWIEPTSDERLTLITCWPYSNNTHRVIVVAKPKPRAATADAHPPGTD